LIDENHLSQEEKGRKEIVAASGSRAIGEVFA